MGQHKLAPTFMPPSNLRAALIRQSGTALFIWLLPLAVFLAAALPSARAVTVDELRCEHLPSPLGIDVTQPRLSWQLQSDQRGERQTAWQVRVADSAAGLAAGQGDLWESGKVASDQSIQIDYAGQPLTSREECFWQVRVWNQKGEASPWSAPSLWSMGLLPPADWGAKWIGLDGQDVTDHLANTSWIWAPMPGPEADGQPATNYFRRLVTIPTGRVIKRATFQYTGDNEGRGWIGEFDLGARNNYRTVKFNDITTRLEPGMTYMFGMTGLATVPHQAAGVVGLLKIEFDSGEPLLIPTDEHWKVSSVAAPGWQTTNFDDSAWAPAKVLAPVGSEPWGDVRIAESRRQTARWLRREFVVPKTVRRATVSFSGLGLSELYLNGKKVGDHVLSPAFSQYDKREYYVTYDVTGRLTGGTNALGVVLGNGRFYADRSKVYAGTVSFGFPKLLLNLHVDYTDGMSAEIVSDESWKLTTDGPILANNDYDGEEYDARREMPGWSLPGFDDAAWLPVQLVSAPGGALSAEMMDPIRVTGTIKPVAITEPRPGMYVFDLGQNMAGWCQLRVSGPAGTRVMLRHAETLKPDGTLYMANLRGAQQTDSYTLRGGGAEVWEPRFTSHGFRYVEVTGFPGAPTLDAITGRVVNDDLPTAGEFLTSNQLLNQIYTNIVWGVRGNYRSIPTDCPQRDERQGWLGDRSEESRGETFLFDNSLLYGKWLRDMADAQRPSGSVPDIAPAYWPIYSDNVSWPSSSIIIPQMLQSQFDDTRIIASHYDSAKKWMAFIGGFVTNGIISRDAYGDWCVPPENLSLIHSSNPARITDKTLLATSYYYNDLRLMEHYAQMLGKTADADRYGMLAAEVKTAFNAQFLNRDLGQYSNGTQTSCVLPLAFGLVPDDLRGVIFQHLVDKIENDTHGHIGTGLVGGQYLMRVLTDNGRPDLAYAMATQKEYPGWGYMVSQGATTIWELWNGNTADPTMNSGNHVMLVGDLVIWFYEDLAGIKSDPAQPGFKHIIMKPLPVGDLTFVQATHRSPYGLIGSAWKKHGHQFDWRIEIPANTTATIYVPADELAQVKESGHPIAQARDVRFVKMEGDRAVLEIGSGSYHFVSK